MIKTAWNLIKERKDFLSSGNLLENSEDNTHTDSLSTSMSLSSPSSIRISATPIVIVSPTQEAQLVTPPSTQDTTNSNSNSSKNNNNHMKIQEVEKAIVANNGNEPLDSKNRAEVIVTNNNNNNNTSNNNNNNTITNEEEGVNETWRIKFEELEYDAEKDEIGSGASAAVYRGRYRGQKVAIKVLSKAPDYQLFIKELQILCTIRSPDVCYFYGACTR